MALRVDERQGPGGKRTHARHARCVGALGLQCRIVALVTAIFGAFVCLEPGLPGLRLPPGNGDDPPNTPVSSLVCWKLAGCGAALSWRHASSGKPSGSMRRARSEPSWFGDDRLNTAPRRSGLATVGPDIHALIASFELLAVLVFIVIFVSPKGMEESPSRWRTVGSTKFPQSARTATSP